MENITVKDLGNGFFSLKAAKGYGLFSLSVQRFVSDAVVKEESMKLFKAVAIDE